jgi:hypothetical protein
MRPLLLLLVPALAAAAPFDPGTALHEAFAPPAGTARVAVAEGSFAAWLRAIPVTEGAPVLRYDGVEVGAPALAVARWDLGSRDLLQCADSAIRLHAEWLRDGGRADEAAYHFTSGDRVTYRQWLAGERYAIRGSRVERSAGEARADTDRGWRRWLDLVFTYAGTRSLPRDTVAVEGAIEAGDLFNEGGSPGHVVVVLDVAEGPDGRFALLGQGLLPARDFHILSGGDRGAWFRLPAPGESLATPSWPPFPRESARRFQKR